MLSIMLHPDDNHFSCQNMLDRPEKINLMVLYSLQSLIASPFLVDVMQVNEGEEQHRTTAQKLSDKHLPRCRLLSLEFYGHIE